MVASRDIDPLELILSEGPAVVGPYSKTSLGCLQCLRKVDGSYTCTNCGLPVCNARCEKGPLHRPECEYFAERRRRWKQNQFETKLSPQTHVCVTPLRMLLTRRSEPKTYARIDMLMDHAEQRASAAVAAATAAAAAVAAANGDGDDGLAARTAAVDTATSAAAAAAVSLNMLRANVVSIQSFCFNPSPYAQIFIHIRELLFPPPS